MARVLSTAVVLALLAATSIAFVITESAKVEKSPIAGTEVTPVFSPTAADEDKRVAHVKFRLRTHERLTVWIQDSRGRKISTLLPPRSVRAGTKFDLLWDGFTGGGVIDLNGVYKPVVKLEHSHRTFLLPSPIQLDTAAPKISVRKVPHAIISPDGDGHRDVFRAAYRINDDAHAIASWRQAVAIDPHQYDALLNIGRLEGHLGHSAEARQALTQFVNSAPKEKYGADIAAARQALTALP